MPIHSPCRRQVAAAAATLVAACSLAAVATALPPTSADGLSQIEIRNDREPVGGAPYAAAAWGFVPGANITVTVPAGNRHLVNARFTAESTCSGPIASWCSVRIGRFASCTDGGALLELLRPDLNNTDFHFDSGGGYYDSEAHAMERSIILDAGTHHLCVQRYAVGGASFTLDDWHYAVESSAAA